MDNYEKGKVIGEGTFGVVSRAICKKTGDPVAIKRIRITEKSEGIHMTALRELKLLKEIKSPTVVRLRDTFQYKQYICLAFDYMDSNLEDVIKDTSLTMTPSDVKGYMQQLLQSLSEVHKLWIVHRDIKPNNLLIDYTGSMKLADFGLARIYGSPDARYTSQVFARWYRAPELLFGAANYTGAVDIWAAGCVFAELLLRRVWLPGSTDLDQLGRIFRARGTPEVTWPGAADLANYVSFQPVPAPPLADQFPGAPPQAVDLLSRMLQLDPNRRVTADEALLHSYFTTAPLPTPPAQLPRLPENTWAAAVRKGLKPEPGDGENGGLNGHTTGDGQTNGHGPSDKEGAAPAGGAKRRLEGGSGEDGVDGFVHKRLRFDDDEKG